MRDREPDPGDDVLAGKLAEARSRLAALDVPADAVDRLRRQFIAICDAIKVSEADEATGLRRLTAFLATLDQMAAKSCGSKD